MTAVCRRSSSLFKSLSLCARLCVYVCRRIESQLVSNSIGVAQMEWGGEGEAEGPRGAGATGVIAAMRFYWGDGAGGSPSAILHPNIPAHLDSAQSSGAAAATAGGGGGTPAPVSWPSSGIAVVTEELGSSAATPRRTRQGPRPPPSSSWAVSVLVVGQLSQPVRPARSSGGGLLESDALSFREIASVLFVVSNPHDPPDLWAYRSKEFPSGGRGQYRW